MAKIDKTAYEGRIWQVECKDKTLNCDLIKEDYQRNDPIVWLECNGYKLSIEFDCRCSFASSSYGTLANVVVINNSRSVRIVGTAKKVHLNAN